MAVYKLDSGRFVVATYNDRACQYQSSDRKAPWQGYCCSYAPTLERLVSDCGIRTYARRADAFRADGDE